MKRNFTLDRCVDSGRKIKKYVASLPPDVPDTPLKRHSVCNAAE